VEAIEKDDPRTKNLFFDVTTVVLPTTGADRLTLIARRLRQLTPQRILFGSDAASGGNLPPREGWAAFRRLPLSEAEFQTIARNVPPYMRDQRTGFAHLDSNQGERWSRVTGGAVPLLIAQGVRKRVLRAEAIRPSHFHDLVVHPKQ
jgi:hypothetical protein